MKKQTLHVISLFRNIATIVVLVSLVLSVPLPVAASSSDQIIVMTRNLYLGVDVYAAAQFLPDVHRASQYLWEQMRQTSFVARAEAFADEVARANPDVIGLQEAAEWYCRDAYAGRAQTVYDYTQIFIDALARHGMTYAVASAPSFLAARHLGFSIPTMPYITEVRDALLFPARYGTDTV